jgi:hypothetical protein
MRRLVARAARSLETFNLEEANESVALGRGLALLMPSTPFTQSHVISRRFAYFRVVNFDISAVQRDFCDGFDSRQLHKGTAGNSSSSAVTVAADSLACCWVR